LASASSKGLLRSLAAIATVFVAIAAFTRTASAQASPTLQANPPKTDQRTDSAFAEQLFDEGKALFTAGDYDGAAQKFAASEAIEPGIGVLLWLGDSQEKAGRLASALATFGKAEQRAKSSGDSREEVARTRKSSLAARAQKLSILCRPGSKMIVDGAAIACGSSPVLVPVDAGLHVVTRDGTDTSVNVAPFPKGMAIVTVPLPVAGSSLSLEQNAAIDRASPFPWRAVGWSAFGLGAAAAIGGGVLIGVGKARYDEAAPRCVNGCGDGNDYDQQLSAITQANIGSVLLISGAIVAAAGLVLVLFAPSTSSSKPKAAGERQLGWAEAGFRWP
jgi:tetratricopeptide (TPR) repeat protein